MKDTTVTTPAPTVADTSATPIDAPAGSRLGRLKRRLLPQGLAPRKLRVGLGRGLTIDIDFAFHTRLFLGFYETELNRYIRQLCRPGMDAFDVGGRDGYDALVMAKLTGGRVVSIDCEPHAAEQMARNFRANPALAPSLASRTGFVGSVDDAATGHITIDTMVAESGFTPDVVKIDIEGWEVEALRGASVLLGGRKPALIIEVHSYDLERECLALLAPYGYETRIVNPRRYVRDYRLVPGNRWIIAT